MQSPEPDDKKLKRKRATPDKRFKCPFADCTKTYVNNGSLASHLNKIHGDVLQAQQEAENKKNMLLEQKENEFRAKRAKWEKLGDPEKLLKELLAMHEQLTTQVEENDILKEQLQHFQVQQQKIQVLQQEESKNAVKTAAQVKSLISSQINSSMVYTNSSLKMKGKQIKVQVPAVSEDVLQSLFGSLLYLEGKKPSSFLLSMDSESMAIVFGRTFSKGLRYGATLELDYPVRVSWKKELKTLTVTTSYKLSK